MITPENEIPLDDSDNSEADDQQSQKDIHSNGFDDGGEVSDDSNTSDADRLQQASDASEPSFTLNTDGAPPSGE
ncbi:MAG: hypothetical protein V4592_23605 [Bacteroidota bacterium]